jgi:hypothetical protein
MLEQHPVVCHLEQGARRQRPLKCDRFVLLGARSGIQAGGFICRDMKTQSAPSPTNTGERGAARFYAFG